MGKEGYFLSPPKLFTPPLSRVSQRWPLPLLVGQCIDKQRVPDSIPCGGKSQPLRSKGGKGLKVFFHSFPIAQQVSTMQRQVTCSQF